MDIQKLLILSNYNLTYETYSGFLPACPWATYRKEDNGWFMYVSDDLSGCPTDLRTVINKARIEGCTWIMFDMDAPSERSLPNYAWETGEFEGVLKYVDFSLNRLVVEKSDGTVARFSVDVNKTPIETFSSLIDQTIVVDFHHNINKAMIVNSVQIKRAVYEYRDTDAAADTAPSDERLGRLNEELAEFVTFDISHGMACALHAYDDAAISIDDVKVVGAGKAFLIWYISNDTSDKLSFIYKHAR